MQPADATSCLEALIASLLGMVDVVNAATRQPGVMTSLGGAELVNGRCEELRQTSHSIRLTQFYVTRGATMSDLRNLVRGAEIVYLLSSRRHFLLMDRITDPGRYSNSTLSPGIPARSRLVAHQSTFVNLTDHVP